MAKTELWGSPEKPHRYRFYGHRHWEHIGESVKANAVWVGVGCSLWVFLNSKILLHFENSEGMPKACWVPPNSDIYKVHPFPGADLQGL